MTELEEKLDHALKWRDDLRARQRRIKVQVYSANEVEDLVDLGSKATAIALSIDVINDAIAHYEERKKEGE